MDPITTLATAAGLSWASGLRLYAVLFLAGLAHATGITQLPNDLQVLAHPLVLAVSGVLLVVEFLADKVPGVDSLWDAIHTFVRVPAGALIAVGALAPVDPHYAIAAALLGGTLAGSSHFTKTGGRLLINASPEPVSNWTASLGEDVLSVTTVWAALMHPMTLLAILVVVLAISFWLLPRIWRALRDGSRRLARFLGLTAPPASRTPPP